MNSKIQNIKKYLKNISNFKMQIMNSKIQNKKIF